MGLPRELWYLRHAESERNQARELLKNAGTRAEKRRALLLLQQILNKPSSAAELSSLGVEQCKLTDAWFRTNGVTFDRYYTSSHIRAKQTAGLLNFPKAGWIVDNNIRERSIGEMEEMDPKERLRYLRKWRNQGHVLDLFNFRPGRGESFADVTDIRWPLFVSELERDCRPKDKVLVVNHGDNMWAARCFHEGWTPQDFVQNRGEESYIKIPNCMILRYTRQNPKNPKQVLPDFGWFQTFCPAAGEEPGEWSLVERKKFTADELLVQVDQQITSVKNLLRKGKLKRVA